MTRVYGHGPAPSPSRKHLQDVAAHSFDILAHMIAIIAFVVFFIFFCVLAFLSAKNWLLRHVFLMLGVFIMTIVFFIFAAMTLRTHEVWKSQFAKLSSDLERTETRIEELSSPAQIAAEEPSLPQLQSELSRWLLARGRVWRGAQVAGVDGNTIQLDMSAWGNSGCVRAGEDVQPVAEEGAAPPAVEPSNMSEKMLVHAFLEGSVAQLAAPEQNVLFGEDGLAQPTRGPCTIPAVYVGHFKVTGTGENSVTLQAVQPLDEQQLAIVDQGGRWTLYEVLPIDDHTTLTGMSAEALQALFASLSAVVPAEKIAASIRDFLRDGSPAETDDPPERIWMQVKFLTDHSIQVDMEAEAAAEDSNFDVRGRAIQAYLQQGGPTEFKAGDVAEFDATTANELVQEGKAELVDEPSRYVRALRNFGLIFQHQFDEIADAQDAIDQTMSENETLIASTEQVRQQITYREEEKSKLGEDLTHYKSDEQAIAVYRDDLVRLRQLQLQELGRLYDQNNSLRAQMSGR